MRYTDPSTYRDYPTQPPYRIHMILYAVIPNVYEIEWAFNSVSEWNIHPAFRKYLTT